MKSIVKQIDNLKKGMKDNSDNLMVKEDWKFPDINGNNVFLAVDISRKNNPKPIVIELEMSSDGFLFGIKKVLSDLASLEYPWIEGYVPNKEAWQEIGFLTIKNLPFFGGGNDILWLNKKDVKIHPHREFSAITMLKIDQVVKRGIYKKHPKLKSGWEHPKLPEDFTNVMVSYGNGEIKPDYRRTDLSDALSADVWATDKGIDVEIEYPWIDGYIPSHEDWHNIGFCVNVQHDGQEIVINPEKSGWL